MPRSRSRPCPQTGPVRRVPSPRQAVAERLRSFRAGRPLLLAGVLTLGTISVAGLALDFANIIALPLLLGVGVAFDIYFVANWRLGDAICLHRQRQRP